MSNDRYDEERPVDDTSAEEYFAGGDNASEDTGTDYDPVTGEPAVTPHDRVLTDSDTEAGNPNSGSSAGLAGDMGISSERTGPADETGTSGLGELGNFETRTVGTAEGRTHGSSETTMPVEGEESPLKDAPGRDPVADLPADPDDTARPRRTVGESNTAEVPSHQLGRKNPGHSGR